MTETEKALGRIRARLADYYEPLEIEIWLTSAHPQLKGGRACDLIQGGRHAEVERVIDRLDSGAYL